MIRVVCMFCSSTLWEKQPLEDDYDFSVDDIDDDYKDDDSIFQRFKESNHVVSDDEDYFVDGQEER